MSVTQKPLRAWSVTFCLLLSLQFAFFSCCPHFSRAQWPRNMVFLLKTVVWFLHFIVVFHWDICILSHELFMTDTKIQDKSYLASHWRMQFSQAAARSKIRNSLWEEAVLLPAQAVRVAKIKISDMDFITTESLICLSLLIQDRDNRVLKISHFIVL